MVYACFVGYASVALLIVILTIMNVARKLFMKNNSVLKLFKQPPPQALLVCAKYKHLLNRNTVSGFCTQQDFCVSFDNPAVKNYLENLVMEFNTIQTEYDCYEGKNKRRFLEIQPVIDIIDERNALNENLASLKELTSG
jgi:hypothetical protein